MPSEKGKEQGTFTEQYLLPYALIGFSGIVNENAAESTMMTQEDLDVLLDGIWNGTKNLISRSKAGQLPRLLLNVIYADKNYHIGDLTSAVSIRSDLADEEIRDVQQYTLVIDNLVDLLTENAEKIKGVEFAHDKRLVCTYHGNKVDIEALLNAQKITTSQLTF